MVNYQLPISLKSFSVFVVLMLLALCAATVAGAALEPDEQYIKISSLIDQGDSLNKSGQTGPARAKYQEAQAALLNFKKSNSSWNTKIVSYRLNYLSEKIAVLSQAVAASAASVPSAGVAETKSATSHSASPVKLLSAGDEPRKVLRLLANPGDKQTAEMTMKSSVRMEAAGTAAPAMTMPMTKMTLETVVKNVSTGDDIVYEITVADAEVADDSGALPQIAEAMKASLANMKGSSSAITLSSRGIAKANETGSPSGADPQLRQAMEQMQESLAHAGVPLPEEAVGPGAKWEFKNPLKSQGMTIDQTATYQLISIEGDRIHVKSTIAQRAANQKIENPSMPGMKVDVSKMTGSANGDTTFTLTQLLPAKATVDSHSDISMSMNLGAQKRTMNMKTDTTTRLETK